MPHKCRTCYPARYHVAPVEPRTKVTVFRGGTVQEERRRAEICACGHGAWEHVRRSGACLRTWCACGVLRHPRRREKQDAARRVA